MSSMVCRPPMKEKQKKNTILSKQHLVREIAMQCKTEATQHPFKWKCLHGKYQMLYLFNRRDFVGCSVDNVSFLKIR